MYEPALPSSGATATVLVVDDEPLLADLTSEWVLEKWTCRKANGGSDALEMVDEGVDVIVLDRQMPDLSGERVLEAIRGRDLSVQVLMVSGVEPDFDIVDLPFDDYLQKPVDRPTLQAKIEELLLRRTYHARIQKFFVCAAKMDLLETAISDVELAEDEQYLSLRAKADELRQAADATLGQMTEHVSKFHDVNADD